jgi:uncharacterized membrane protein YphA (DoxX/SURF4 family)
MKRYQTGEVMLVIMVVMLAVIWLGSGHMGMMGMEHSGGHAEMAGDTAEQAKPESSQTAVQQETHEHQQ